MLLAPAQATLAQVYASHTVVSGDTLFGLAERYATTVDELVRVNGLNTRTIRVGQVLNVPGVAGTGPTSEAKPIVAHTVAAGETLGSVSQAYGVPEDHLRLANPTYAEALADAPLLAGLTLYIPPGAGEVVLMAEGENLLSLALGRGFTPSELAEANGVSSPSALQPGQPVFIPQQANRSGPVIEASVAVSVPATDLTSREQHLLRQRQAVDRASALLATYEPAPVYDTFIWPVSGRITSSYGRRNISVGGNTFHGGVDISAASGTPVGASRAGVVTRSGWGGAYGYVIYVDHPDGSQTRYAHLSKLGAVPGDRVGQGQTVGWVGSTGASTGPHLHFEIRFGGRSVDPLGYLQSF